jgi:D-3-phosphoglycerate dehydrogenase / 2-oxoglutarate reductase
LKITLIGDGMITADTMARAALGLKVKIIELQALDWILDKVELQKVRRKIEAVGPSAVDLPQGILTKALDSEIILVHYAPISGNLIRAARNLKIIGTCRAGFDNLDISSATQANVVAFKIMGRNAEAVSDFTVGLILAESRNIARSHMLLRQGKWLKPPEENIHNLAGRNVGIIGFGYVGQLVAKKLSSFNVNITVYDPYVGADTVRKAGASQTSLDELFRHSDFICVHARLTKENEGMINERLISLMKPTSYIINSARAGLVNETSLCDALREKRIAGAALDVFWDEPLPKGHILTKLDNVTLTSHLAGTTIESLIQSPQLLIEDINRLLIGTEPIGVINPGALRTFSMSETK